MKFCSSCGSNQLERRIPEGDNRLRFICNECTVIHYENPRIICGTLPIYEHKVLLCKRAIEPRKGFWTLPAGFMENGETIQEGASRETWEEAMAKVELDGLYAIFNLPHISQVYMFFRAQVIDGNYGIGSESLEVELFEEANIPWKELAFPTVNRALEFYFEDRKTNHYPIRIEDMTFKKRPS